MKKSLIIKLFVAVAATLWLSSAAFAQEIPPHLVHQGRLMDALNAPITGTRDLTFNLYAEETAGTSFWTETQTVLLTEGFYSVTLGQGQSLDLSRFDGAVLYLGVTIDGEELAPRMALRSVPYAIKSGTSQNAVSAQTADNVTGDITPTSITVGGTVIDSSGITINGATVIDGSGQWSGPEPVVDYNNILNPPTTFDSLNCLNGDVAQFVGGAWTCTPASSADTLSGLGCAEGQTAKFIAGAWACADDTDTDTNTTYTAGNGITIGASNDIAADTAVLQNRVFGTCSAGFSIRQVNADGSVVCEDDSNTTYVAGAGVTITGVNNTIAVDTAAIQGRVSGVCVVGESIRQINADGTVICEPDTDTDTTYSAATGGGLVLSGTNAFGIAPDAITSARIADGTITSADIANGTIVAADTDANSIQARVTGVCPVNESIRTISATGTVVCEPDSDTTYSAGAGLTLSATNQFSVNTTQSLGTINGVSGSLQVNGNLTVSGTLSAGCPAGMGRVANYCIHTESPYPRGLNWWTAMDTCLNDGFRLCSQTEIVNAARKGVLRQYTWAEGDSWYLTGSQAENSPGAGGENQICDVQGNIDQAGHPQYSVQCQHEKDWTSSWRTTVCCY